VTLRLGVVRARGERRGAVLCGHAMMTDARYFAVRRPDGFAAHLAARGLDVIAVDWRGHGASQPPRAGGGAGSPDGDWSFDDLVELDLPAALAATAAATGVAPRELAVLGHSLGGLVALAALGTGVIAPPRRLVLAATSVWLPGPHGDWRRRAGMAIAARVAAALGRMPVRALRAGTADEAATYTAQLTGWARTGRWTSRHGVDYLAALDRLDEPRRVDAGGAGVGPRGIDEPRRVDGGGDPAGSAGGAGVGPRGIDLSAAAPWAFTGAGDWMCRPRDAAELVRPLRGARPLEVIGRATGYAIDADHFTLFTRRELAPLWDRIAAELIS
jgi:predicted alpha/beta hydrolase